MQDRFGFPPSLPPSVSLGFAAFVLALDYAVGPQVEFPGMFLVPAAYGAWYGGRRWGLPLSLLPLAHIGTVAVLGAPSDIYPAFLTACVRVILLSLIVWWIAGLAEAQRALVKEVAMLQGLLPICSYCKRIRDDGGTWEVLEKYIQERSDATFTHGVCESCLREQFPDFTPGGQRRAG